jgi:hypothetical protein
LAARFDPKMAWALLLVQAHERERGGAPPKNKPPVGVPARRTNADFQPAAFSPRTSPQRRLVPRSSRIQVGEDEEEGEEEDDDAELLGRRPVRKKESLRDILGSDPPWAAGPAPPPLPTVKDDQRSRCSGGRPELVPNAGLAPPSTKTSIGAHSTRSTSNLSTSSTSDHLGGGADLHTFPIPPAREPAREHSPAPSSGGDRPAPALPKVESEPFDLGLPLSATSTNASLPARRRLQPKGERTAGSSKDLMDFLANSAPPPSNAPTLPRSESSASVDSSTKFGKKSSSSRFRSFMSRLGAQRDDNSGSVDLNRRGGGSDLRAVSSTGSSVAVGGHTRERSLTAGSLSRKLSKRDRLPRSSSAQSAVDLTGRSSSTHQNGVHDATNGSSYANTPTVAVVSEAKVLEDLEDVKVSPHPVPEEPVPQVPQELAQPKKLPARSPPASPATASKSTSQRRVPTSPGVAPSEPEQGSLPPSPTAYIEPVSPVVRASPALSGVSADSRQPPVAVPDEEKNVSALSVPPPPAVSASSAEGSDGRDGKDDKSSRHGSGDAVDFVAALEALRAQMAKASSVDECLKLMDIAIAGATSGAGRQKKSASSASGVKEAGDVADEGKAKKAVEEKVMVGTAGAAAGEDDDVELATVAAWFLEPSDFPSISPVLESSPATGAAEGTPEQNKDVVVAADDSSEAVPPPSPRSEPVASEFPAKAATKDEPPVVLASSFPQPPPSSPLPAAVDQNGSPQVPASSKDSRRPKRSRPTPPTAAVVATGASEAAHPPALAAEAALAP